MKVWRVMLIYNDKPQSFVIDKNIKQYADCFAAMEPDGNDAFKIECLDMDEDEYAKLPEFMGW